MKTGGGGGLWIRRMGIEWRVRRRRNGKEEKEEWKGGEGEEGGKEKKEGRSASFEAAPIIECCYQISRAHQPTATNTPSCSVSIVHSSSLKFTQVHSRSLKFLEKQLTLKKQNMLSALSITFAHQVFLR